MKQSENNEIDTLLRNLARRERAVQTRPDSAPASTPGDFAARGAHLDVDELSSYAERALPPSARARCTAHLADCNDCRKIVAQLAMAAGPLTEERKMEGGAVVGLSLVQRLSVLLSPRMIRYAMPALVLVVVAVGFFVWRQQRPGGFADQVARIEKPEPAVASKAPGEQTAGTTQPVQTKRGGGDIAAEREQKKEEKAQPTPAGSEPASGRKTEDQISDEKKSGAVAGGLAPASKAAKADAPAADKSAERQPAYAAEPAPPAAKPQSSVAVNQEQSKDLAKNSNIDGLDRSRDTNVQQQRKGPARNDNEVAQRGPAKGQAQPASKMKAAETGSASGARAEDDEAETRTVFGRRFRRLNNAWVDSDYKSSMSIRSVTRDTEAYRALVADEPVIGGIGKQLSGEVIVVWKGHAYRIN